MEMTRNIKIHLMIQMKFWMREIKNCVIRNLMVMKNSKITLKKQRRDKVVELMEVMSGKDERL